MLGGFVTSALGYQAAFLLNALSFVVSALLVASIPSSPAHRPGADAKRTGFLSEFADGGRHVLADPPVLALLSIKPAWACGSAIALVLVQYGSRVFPTGRRARSRSGY